MASNTFLLLGDTCDANAEYATPLTGA